MDQNKLGRLIINIRFKNFRNEHRTERLGNDVSNVFIYGIVSADININVV